MHICFVSVTGVASVFDRYTSGQNAVLVDGWQVDLPCDAKEQGVLKLVLELFFGCTD